MAKRRSSGGGSARKTKATSRRPSKPAAAEVEVVEEDSGEGIDTGILVVTFLMLFGAVLFVDALLGRFDKGMFFGG